MEVDPTKTGLGTQVLDIEPNVPQKPDAFIHEDFTKVTEFVTKKLQALTQRHTSENIQRLQISKEHQIRKVNKASAFFGAVLSLVTLIASRIFEWSTRTTLIVLGVDLLATLVFRALAIEAQKTSELKYDFVPKLEEDLAVLKGLNYESRELEAWNKAEEAFTRIDTEFTNNPLVAKELKISDEQYTFIKAVISDTILTNKDLITQSADQKERLINLYNERITNLRGDNLTDGITAILLPPAEVK